MQATSRTAHLTQYAPAVLLSLTCFFAAALLTWLVAADSPRLLELVTDPPVLIGVATVIALSVVAGHARREARVLAGLWILVLVSSAINIILALRPVLIYGDGNILVLMLAQGIVPAKWLAGYELLDVVYSGIWKATPIASAVQRNLGGVDVFVMLASACAVGGGSICVLHRWGDHLATRMAVISPFLLILGAGYREYYPFIICLYLATLCVAFLRPLNEHPAWLFGAMTGILPAAYIGFIPWAVMLLIAFWTAQPRKWGVTFMSAAASFLLCVRVFWSGSFRQFFSEYHANLRLYHRIPFVRYDLKISENRSIFFDAGYVFTSEHFVDLLYVALYLGLYLTLALFVAGLAYVHWRARPEYAKLARDPRFWLAAALVIQQTHYFLFMVPHFGPRHDIDVYFTVPVVAMFFAGLCWQRVTTVRGLANARMFSLIAPPIILGHAAVVSSLMLFHGLPNIYRGMDHEIAVGPTGAKISTDELLLALDGAGIVENDEPELFVYATFPTTIACEIHYSGQRPTGFNATQHFAQATDATRVEIFLNGQAVSHWGGASQEARGRRRTFPVTLQPGSNLLEYRMAPVEKQSSQASAHIGNLELLPQ